MDSDEDDIHQLVSVEELLGGLKIANTGEIKGSLTVANFVNWGPKFNILRKTKQKNSKHF